MPEASGVPSEHQFTRPDARQPVKADPPSWAGEALAWPGLIGFLAAVIAFFLYLFAPAIYLRDVRVNIFMFYISMPVAAVLAPITGGIIGKLLSDAIKRDLSRDMPSRTRVKFRIRLVFALLAMGAIGTLLAIVKTPGWSSL